MKKNTIFNEQPVQGRTQELILGGGVLFLCFENGLKIVMSNKNLQESTGFPEKDAQLLKY